MLNKKEKNNFIMFTDSYSLHDELVKLKKINNEININKLKFKNSYDKWEYSCSDSKEIRKQKGNIYTFVATFSPSNGCYYKGYNWIDVTYTCRYIKTQDRLIIKQIDKVTIS